MRIAMIGQKGIPAHLGGIERHVEELSMRLVQRGMVVTVYTRPWYTQVSRTRYAGVQLVSLPSLRSKYLDAISHTFLATIHAMRSDAEVLHYHGVGPALLSFLPRIFTPQKRVIATFHCIDRRHEKWGFLARAILALGEAAACTFPHETVVVSRTLQHYVENVYRSAVRYIPNGVALPGVGNLKTLRRLGLAPQGYVLVVTRFVRHKGVHTVLAAWEKMQKLPAYKDLQLVLVGGASFQDSYVPEIQSHAGRLERVHLLGVREGEELATLYRYARVFVHASVSEGLPIVVLEAMVAGIPVLTSDIPEHMELVSEHGWSFATGNPMALAQVLKAILARPSQAEAKARQAKRWVTRHFSWEMITDETVRLYGHPIAAPRARKAVARAV